MEKNCKCKLCKEDFYTEAPSRIANPICAGCLRKERARKDFEKVEWTRFDPAEIYSAQEELREKFGGCPGCDRPLFPLQSFKHDGVMYCGGCYDLSKSGQLKSKKCGQKYVLHTKIIEKAEA